MTGAQLADVVIRSLRPPPDLTVKEWADEYRIIPAGFTEPGRWRTDRAPYQAEIMDCITDPAVSEIWVRKSSQVGWTEIVNNAVGYYACQNPMPIMVMQPTLDMAETWSKNRLRPMIESTPVCLQTFGNPKTRIAGNTLLYKEFPGGYIWICGANSAASLASNPIPVVVCDEVDRYPASAGDEGDPISIAQARSITFWNRRFIAGSTPTITGVSRIDKGYESGDQREYFILCKQCGEPHILDWEQLDFSRRGMIKEPVHVCPHCGYTMLNHEKHERLKKDNGAKWVAGKEFKGIASFQINALYSPWATFADMVSAFLKAKKGGPEMLKTWKNTWRGMSYEERGESIDVKDLTTRERFNEVAETGETVIPADVLVLTAGIDVQDDRVECEIVGWGDGEESWSITYEILHGSPLNPILHAKLDELLNTSWKCEDGRILKIPITGIDSGDGDWTKYIYEFCQTRMKRSAGSPVFNRGILPFKGANLFSHPIIKEPSFSKKARGKITPWMIGSSQAKLVVMERLRITEPGPGFCHFPSHYEQKYFEGLTAEKLMTVYSKGFPVKVWHKIRHYNEPLDCRVYNLAALRILRPNWEALKEAKPKMQKPVIVDKTEEKERKPAVIRRKRPARRLRLG